MSKTIKILVIALLVVVNLALSFGAGYTLGTRITPGSGQDGLGIVEEAWSIIFQHYVDRDSFDASTLSQAAINGMVEVLDDPYTSYLDAEAYQLSLSRVEGKIDGIGVLAAVRDNQLMIIAPIADSPAAKAGIRAGDKILQINGRLASEMSLAEAVLNIRGPKGTPVKLLILHQGETEPEEIEIVRAEIKLPSVRFEMREDIAYIHITHFSLGTDKELSVALDSITREAATGIILDLRSNPGGMLSSVVDAASYFLREGVVVNIVNNQGEQTAMTVKNKGVTTDLPMVVLVNSYSASGSEVLAGALQDYARATIVGTKTYGKGSVNTLYQLKDGSGLYITSARWLTPKGHLIEGKGITPDYELSGEDVIGWAIDYLKDNI